MNQHLPFRIHPLLAAVIVVGAVFALLFGGYGLTRWASQGEVMGRVEVAETSIGGLTEDAALAVILTLEDEYQARVAVFSLDQTTVQLNPRHVGFTFDEEAMLAAAMRIGREGNAVRQFLWWLSNIFSTNEVQVEGSIDPAAMDEIFDVWDAEVIAQPAKLGGLDKEGGQVVPVYPEEGRGVSRSAAAAIIESTLLSPEHALNTLPTDTIIPELTDADVDNALAQAHELLSGPIELAHDGERVTFTVDQLVEAFVSETVVESRPSIVNYFDPEVIDTHIEPVRSHFEAAPVNARFEISGDNISIRPGSKGTRIDEVESAERLFRAGLSPARLGQLPVVEDADPEVTTEYLESLGINHLVSSFTTHHSCCENRVTNIQLMADTVSMTLVPPGQSFSLNNHVGERTSEKGYLPAGTLIGGELVDTVGGGVSQFATTLYNAVFWGGYEDVEHRPHSFYFSRYPEGIEATVHWRSPDLVFRNNRDSGVLIHTQYTGTSITVRLFGNNDGRIVKGEQAGGNTRMNVVASGGPNALHVEGRVSERHSFTDPPSPRYEANPALEVEQQVTRQGERGGWSVTVTRRILRGGNDLVEERQWVVRYLPQRAIFEVHPCMMPGTDVECPEPTTTTTEPEPTTTATTEPPEPTTPPGD